MFFSSEPSLRSTWTFLSSFLLLVVRWSASNRSTVGRRRRAIDCFGANPHEDIPTQFVPSPNSLSDEAIGSAAMMDFSGVPVA